MRTIHKQTVPIGSCEYKRTVPGKIIHVGYQPNTNLITFWYEFDPEDVANTENLIRTFLVVGTGWDIPDNATHVGTVITGAFVWHLYEIVER